MSERKLHLRTLLDAGVPDSVGHVFSSHGHIVIHYRDVLIDGAKDEVVCATALENSAILVAVDGDMKRLPKRYGAPQAERFNGLSIIRLCCNETLASKRLDQAMSLIEHEWQYREAKAARRLWVEIGPHSIRTHR